jgi:hypothetical protein
MYIDIYIYTHTPQVLAACTPDRLSAGTAGLAGRGARVPTPPTAPDARRAAAEWAALAAGLLAVDPARRLSARDALARPPLAAAPACIRPAAAGPGPAGPLRGRPASLPSGTLAASSSFAAASASSAAAAAAAATAAASDSSTATDPSERGSEASRRLRREGSDSEAVAARAAAARGGPDSDERRDVFRLGRGAGTSCAAPAGRRHRRGMDRALASHGPGPGGGPTARNGPEPLAAGWSPPPPAGEPAMRAQLGRALEGAGLREGGWRSQTWEAYAPGGLTGGLRQRRKSIKSYA